VGKEVAEEERRGGALRKLWTADGASPRLRVNLRRERKADEKVCLREVSRKRERRLEQQHGLLRRGYNKTGVGRTSRRRRGVINIASETLGPTREWSTIKRAGVYLRQGKEKGISRLSGNYPFGYFRVLKKGENREVWRNLERGPRK